MVAAKITILTSDVGGGHRSVAYSIAAALEGLHPGRFEVSTFDFLMEGAPWPLRRAGRIYAFAATRLRPLWHLAYHLSDGPQRARLAQWFSRPLYYRRLKAILRRTAPDLVISCHPLSSSASAGALSDRVPIVVAVSDLTAIHALWVCPEAELCLVATEMARQRALAYGMAPQRIQVVGLPVHPAFLRQNSDRDREKLREGWGLAPRRFTALLSGGGEGIGHLQPVVEALDNARLPLQLVVVCGRNETLRRRLALRTWQVPARVVGFTDRMPELLRLADCLLTKAGPSSIAEGLACGLPLILFDFVPGQEESNVEYVVESEAGVFAPTPQRAREAVEKLWGDPSLRQRMRAAARAIARPEAAWDAARRIAELL